MDAFADSPTLLFPFDEGRNSIGLSGFLLLFIREIAMLLFYGPSSIVYCNRQQRGRFFYLIFVWLALSILIEKR